MERKNLNILLIEDDKIEVIKLQRAIALEFKDFQFSLAKNGSEALNILQSEQYNIILLDLNMPDTNGLEFLTILKNNEDLKHIPVIVLTTSDNEKDIYECYKLGIAGYLLKPLKYEDYELKIKTIMKYWSLNEFIPL